MFIVVRFQLKRVTSICFIDTSIADKPNQRKQQVQQPMTNDQSFILLYHMYFLMIYELVELGSSPLNALAHKNKRSKGDRRDWKENTS